MSDITTIELYVSGLSTLLSDVGDERGSHNAAPLQKWLTRAHREQVDHTNLLQQFCHGLQIESTADELPLAALSHYFYSSEKPAYVLYIDPVHLKPDRDHLILFGPKSLSLSMLEAKKIRDELVACYQDLAWKIDCCDANNWVLILDQPPQENFNPLSDVIGKSIGDYLPTGPNRNYWLNINNEIQMLLHNHPTNLEREQQGKLTANSVWFWGGGGLQTLLKKNIEPGQDYRVWSDNSCAAGLATFAAVDVKELPADINIILNAESTFRTEKIYLDLLNSSSILAESHTQTQQLTSFVKMWISPVMEALASKKIEQLRLYDNRGRCFTLNYRQLKHWWKRLKPLSAYF